MKRIVVAQAVLVFSTYGLAPVNEELNARGMKSVTDLDAGANLLALGVRSLDEFAATVVNLAHGSISADELAAGMAQAFPNHKIGDRHGSHYLSHARNGGLGGDIPCRYTVAKATRKGGAKTKGVDLSNVDTERLTSMAESVAGTPFESVIKAEIALRAKAAEEKAAIVAEVQKAEDEKPPVEETHRQRRERERKEAAAAK